MHDYTHALILSTPKGDKMTKLTQLLLVTLICLFSNKMVNSLYTNFFEYGDRDNNKIITKEEAENVANLAWQFEWYQLKKKMPETVKTKEDGSVTFKDFMEMSLENGNLLLL